MSHGVGVAPASRVESYRKGPNPAGPDPSIPPNTADVVMLQTGLPAINGGILTPLSGPGDAFVSKVNTCLVDKGEH